jgi:Cellulase (glycosyl hydrolase family 5)
MINQAQDLDAKNFIKQGSWFRDSFQRFVLFRGVNIASRSKLSPYLPIFPLQNNIELTLENLRREIELVNPQIDILRSLGLNTVRLLVMWKAIEPSPNSNLEELLPSGKQYLTFVKEIIDKLYSKGLFVIIDFHQDLAHEIYGGDGFPDWALAIDPFHGKPLKPATLKDRYWSIQYYINYLARHTLESFWKNSLTNVEMNLQNYPVRNHLEKTIGQTVKFFKSTNDKRGHPAILGYSPFNEPHPAGLDKRPFERQFLNEFYSNVLEEISKYDNNTFIFIEPRVDWTVYPAQDNNDVFNEFTFIKHPSQIQTFLPDDSKFIQQYASKGVLSFHYYDPWTTSYSFLNIPDNMDNKKKEWPSIFSKLREAAVSRGLIPFLTEFGGSQDWERLQTNLSPSNLYHNEQVRAYMDLQFTQIETHLLNATYWNYDFYNTKENKDNWNLENFSLLGPNRTPKNLDIAARPYPLYSSGEPQLLSFSLASLYCIIILKNPIVDAPTVIYIPYNIHYKPIFKIWATSNRIEWNPEQQLLCWYPNKDKLLNQIIITPPGDLDKSLLPEQSKSLLDELKFVKEFGQ